MKIVQLLSTIIGMHQVNILVTLINGINKDMKETSIKSDYIQYFFAKYYFLVLIFLTPLFLLHNNIHLTIENVLVAVIIIIVFVLLHLLTGNDIYHADMNESRIILSSKKVISWDDIGELSLKNAGLYRLKLRTEEVFYFPSSDLPIRFFRHELVQTEMSVLIQKMKKKHGIS